MAAHITVRFDGLKNERAHHFDTIQDSRVQARRKPLSLMAVAMRIHQSMLDLAKERGFDLLSATIGGTAELLDDVFAEYNSFGLNASNKNYNLDLLTIKGITNILLFTGIIRCQTCCPIHHFLVIFH